MTKSPPIARIHDGIEIKDPRGVLWLWEEPSPRESYVMGADPTVGITGWDRHLRLKGDKDTDNAAIEVIRVGHAGKRDSHVAEYAAPIDAIDLAYVAAEIGHMYRGVSEDGALAIVETNGPGLLTQQEMMTRFNYQNMYVWKQFGSTTPRRTTNFGWYATPDSNKALFLKCLRHIDKSLIDVRSPWLVDEFADCTTDWVKAQLRAKWGRHDDRVRAFFLAIWAAHDWTSFQDTYEANMDTNKHPVNLVATDCSSEQMEQIINDSISAQLDHR